jgi:hypothetical protein
MTKLKIPRRGDRPLAREFTKQLAGSYRSCEVVFPIAAFLVALLIRGGPAISK